MTNYIDLIDSNGNEWTRTNRFREAKETIAAQSEEISHMRGVMECHAIDLRERDAAIKFHAEKARAQSAVIEKLREAIKAVEIDSEEVLDFDEFTAMMVPMDTYHALIEALPTPTDSTQILAEVRRAERERVAQFVDDNCTYGDTHILVKAIRAME